MGAQQDRRRELVRGRQAVGLLLGLLGQPASLRPELAEDVLDATEQFAGQRDVPRPVHFGLHDVDAARAGVPRLRLA